MASMENRPVAAAEPAHSSSDAWTLNVPATHLPAARRWLLLGLAALAGAGLYALLLLWTRLPGAPAWLPAGDRLRIAQVDLAEPVWFLACAGLLWTLRDGPHAAWDRRLFALAVAGVVLIAVTPFTGGGVALADGQLPLLASPLFLGGLLLFAAGLTVRAFFCLQAGLEAAHRSPVAAGLLLAAVATLLVAFTALRTGLKLPAVGDPALRYALLFWPVGHVLQFAYTALALTAWVWLAAGSGLRPYGGPRLATLLLLSGVLPLVGVPLIEIMFVAGSAEQRVLYTVLTRWGGLWPALPLGLLLLSGLLAGPRAGVAERPARTALGASLLLFTAAFGWSLLGLEVVVPARYPALVAGTTLALMGLVYHLLPRLGRREAAPRLAHGQLLAYAAGQLLHLAGRAWAGLGATADAPGAEWLRELGGLLALLAGLLFLVVCYRALRPFRAPAGAGPG
jgi:hypothetical protein